MNETAAKVIAGIVFFLGSAAFVGAWVATGFYVAHFILEVLL
jgi:hypothetical protein